MNWIETLSDIDHIRHLLMWKPKTVNWLDGTHNADIAVKCEEYIATGNNHQDLERAAMICGGTPEVVKLAVIREAVLMLDAEFLNQMQQGMD